MDASARTALCAGLEISTGRRILGRCHLGATKSITNQARRAHETGNLRKKKRLIRVSTFRRHCCNNKAENAHQRLCNPLFVDYTQAGCVFLFRLAENKTENTTHRPERRDPHLQLITSCGCRGCGVRVSRTRPSWCHAFSRPYYLLPLLEDTRTNKPNIRKQPGVTHEP